MRLQTPRVGRLGPFAGRAPHAYLRGRGRRRGGLMPATSHDVTSMPNR